MGEDEMVGDPNILDMQELLDRIGDDKEFALELLQEFRQSLDQDLQTLKKTFESGDAKAATERSHALKGSALNLSAKSFAAVARLMEDASKRGDVEEASSSYPDLVTEAERLKETIDGLS